MRSIPTSHVGPDQSDPRPSPHPNPLPTGFEVGRGRGSHATAPPRVLEAFFQKIFQAAERPASTNKTSILHQALCRPVLHMPYTTVNITLLHTITRMVLQARLLDNQEGANSEPCVRLRKGLRETFPTLTLLAPTLIYSNCCGDIDHGKSPEGCVCVIFTVLYGRVGPIGSLSIEPRARLLCLRAIANKNARKRKNSRLILFCLIGHHYNDRAVIYQHTLFTGSHGNESPPCTQKPTHTPLFLQTKLGPDCYKFTPP